MALNGGDPLAAVPGAVDRAHEGHRERWAAVLASDWHPDSATEFNGAVRPRRGTALWTLRTTHTYENALAAAVDVGGDTGTVAWPGGAVYGFGAIPARWTEPLHVPLPGTGYRGHQTWWTWPGQLERASHVTIPTDIRNPRTCA